MTDTNQALERLLAQQLKNQQSETTWKKVRFITKAVLALLVIVLTAKSCNTHQNSDITIQPNTPHLAMVNVEGVIGMDGTSAYYTNEALDRAFEAENAKAVVLNINSPGGSPVQSDDIWQHIQQLKKKYSDKKVYAVIGDMGASGAYYIASAADEIWVNPSSLIGSIGVILPNYGVSELAKKLGITDQTMTAGVHKDILSMTRPLTEEERLHVQGVLDDVHDHFINAVKMGRGKRLTGDPAQIFSGLFWSGAQAIPLGLADQAGSIYTLQNKLDVDSVVDYSLEPNPLELLLGKLGSQMGQNMAQHMVKGMQHELQQGLSNNQPRLQ